MFLNFRFLFVLFPLSLLLYHCVPQRWKQPILLGTSILFLVLWQAECSLLFFGLIFLPGLFSRLLAHLSPRTLPARLLLLFHDAIYIAALFVLRPPHEGHLFGMALYPVGISILALQSISYVHLIFRRAILPERHRSSFAFYFCFYPKLLFGPYCSVSTFHRIQPDRRCQVEQVGNGLHQLVCGLAKAVLLSGQFYLIIQQMQAASKEHNTLFFSWLYQLLFFLYVYFQLTGYTDMARGIAACYGYALPKSSRLPLWNKQLSVFLQNWNRTVLRWFSRAFSSLVLIHYLQRVCMEFVLLGHPDRSRPNVGQLAWTEQRCGQLSRPVFPTNQLAVAADCRILYKWLASFHSEVVEKANADCLDSDDYCSRGRCALFRAECTCNGKQCRSATVFPLVTVF